MTLTLSTLRLTAVLCALKAAMTADNPAPRQTSGRIRDARGRRVSQLDPVALYLLRRHDMIEADALQGIANEKGVRITARERVALRAGLCSVLLVMGFFTHALITGDIRNATFAKTASLLWCCSIPWIIWFAIARCGRPRPRTTPGR